MLLRLLKLILSVWFMGCGELCGIIFSLKLKSFVWPGIPGILCGSEVPTFVCHECFYYALLSLLHEGALQASIFFKQTVQVYIYTYPSTIYCTSALNEHWISTADIFKNKVLQKEQNIA